MGRFFYYYVGVGGKARKVKKVYVGVGGKARLVYVAYIPVTSIKLGWEANYNWGTGESDAYHATITAQLTPANATDQKVTWSITKNGSTIHSMVISTNTSLVCVVSPEVRYGGECILAAKSTNGVVSYLYCRCSGIDGRGWTFIPVSNPDKFPRT